MACLDRFQKIGSFIIYSIACTRLDDSTSPTLHDYDRVQGAGGFMRTGAVPGRGKPAENTGWGAFGAYRKGRLADRFENPFRLAVFLEGIFCGWSMFPAA
ncbi:MAG: hypothetical protein C4519_00710 [Desulfobacteraceae bacterium]|nr:MAG: hypothetical protein C4519_00710 [Desulfobacteraceae bacterium]